VANGLAPEAKTGEEKGFRAGLKKLSDCEFRTYTEPELTAIDN
jgi:hypothetical protein